jgi:starch synthase
VWTRDLVAAVSAIRTGLPTVFETYRPDVATARSFAPWRAMTLGHPAMLGVIAHSRLTFDAFVNAGVPREHALLAHNGYAPSLMLPELTRDEARDRLRLPRDRALVVYTGHVGPKKGIDALIRLAAQLPETTFVVVGVDEQSSDRRSIQGLAAMHGASNLLLVPRVPLTDVSAYLYAADVLIVPPTDEPLKRFRRTVLPMKLFSYLAAGRPIVAPDLDDTREVLVDGVNACLVSPTSVQSAAERMRALLGDRALQERLSLAARESSRSLTWTARAERIVPFLDALTRDVRLRTA